MLALNVFSLITGAVAALVSMFWIGAALLLYWLPPSLQYYRTRR